ncbi:MAG: hypothetical protein JNM81_01945 [Rhodospirillaceae bacterium]|nr:hypothetical protein [Rhodospirillaceae bacterium]
MTFLRTTIVAVSVGLAAASLPGQAFAAQCVKVLLKDQNGTMIKTDSDIIGLVVDGIRPLVNQDLPFGSISEPGEPTACTPDVVAAVQQLFDTSCLSDKTRDATAKANGQPIEEINARCQAIFKALKK